MYYWVIGSFVMCSFICYFDFFIGDVLMKKIVCNFFGVVVFVLCVLIL